MHPLLYINDYKMKELILGIDDAGRGPVIGPLVLAGCLIDSDNQKELRELGVKDSKDLTPKRRKFLSKKIKEKSETFEIIPVKPSDIDGIEGGQSRIKLNEIEANAAAEIINKINTGKQKIKVVIDCPSTNLSKWKDYLLTKIAVLSNLEVSCEHKADRNHLAVSAASILAKETREKEMEKLKEIYGNEIGSGYSSDPVTIRFVEKYAIKYENEGIFRKTWETWKISYKKLVQKKLDF